MIITNIKMLQQLSYRLKLKLNLVNPFDIKPEFKYLAGSQRPASLVSKEQVSASSHLMRFALQDQEKCLGATVGQYIAISDQKYDPHLLKYYSPISRIDDIGIFDLLVYRVPQEQKSFSQHLLALSIGAQVQINGPYTSYLYKGYGRFQLEGDAIRKFRFVGLVAEQTGIAAFFQLIEAVATNGDNTHIGLYYVADNLDEFVFLEEIIWLVNERKIKATFHARKENEPLKRLFPGPKGEILDLEQRLPPPGDDTLIMVCGGKQFKSDVHNQLVAQGHKNIKII